MQRRMSNIIANLTEPQRVALLFMALGVCFFLAGFLSWMENQ